jgi:peroxiredoxin
MKRSLLNLLLALPLWVVAQTTPGVAILKGKISGIGENTAVIKVFVDRYGTTSFTDSTIVKNGAFTFTFKINEPVWSTLHVRIKGDSAASRKTHYFYIDKGAANASFALDAVDKAIVNGFPVNDAWRTFEEENKSTTDSLMSAMNVYYNLSDNHTDSELILAAEDVVDSLQKVYTAAEVKYIETHPESYLGLSFLTREMRHGMQVEQAMPLFTHLHTSVKQTALGKNVNKELIAEAKFAIGQPAPDFSQVDTAGRAVSLASFKGKYVLVDFWASWCKPCRLENPNVVKAFEQYKGNHFSILGVSLDMAEKNWKEAIHADQLAWTQVIDKENKVSKQYNITSIPSNFLLDKEGRIIAKNLRGDELEKKLAEVLK